MLFCAAVLWLCLWAGLLVSPATAAQAANAEVGELRLERAEDGLYLGANLQFDLPELAEDALYKGIPMFFVADAQVLRDRWYWSDRLVAETTRYFRLSYQPLTRRWRLSQADGSSAPRVALAQSYDSLAEAQGAIERISSWKIAESSEVDASEHFLNFRFRLDLSQLPQPLQFGVLGGGSGLEYTQSLKLQEDSFK